MRILFVSSEIHPLMKTGGLADVSASLPRALQARGHQVRLLMPAYRDALRNASAYGVKLVKTFELDGHAVRLLETRLPGTRNKLWLIDCPPLFDRPGNPYRTAGGVDYPDNAARFMLLCRVGALIARDALGLDWKPDVVHCNDWQTGMIPVLLYEDWPRPALIFTIHNIAYQGLFSAADFRQLGLAERYWHHEALEFHGMLSFIKGGIVYADRITTVSPTYALEIQTGPFGNGLHGLLRHRASALRGILNGIDTNDWNPARDAALTVNYSAASLQKKRVNKIALQAELALDPQPNLPLVAFIGRLVEQKGIDLIIAALPAFVQSRAQAVLLGSGDLHYESALAGLAADFPGKVALRIGYDESLAHRIEAASDIFLMPSRFEPCGLNQMYSLHYGTIPVVHSVGGLADTVVDTTPATFAAGTATGFVFRENSRTAFSAALQRALSTWHDESTWRQLQLTGMKRDFSWRHSALEYEQLYQDALSNQAR
jgi:starch synthase